MANKRRKVVRSPDTVNHRTHLPEIEYLPMNWSKLCAGPGVILTLLCSADPGAVAQTSGVSFSGPCALQDFPAGTALFPVEGRVVDDLTGAGISGATVRLTSMCLPDHVEALATRMKQETVTDGDGSFSFQDVPEISVNIVAEKGNHDYLELWPFRHRVDDPIATYKVGPDSGSIILRLAPAASISGVVHDEHGAPIGDAWISLWAYRTWEGWPQLGFWNAVKTNPDGSYNRQSLPPGRYYLIASPDPYRSGVPFTHDKHGNALGLVPVRFPVQPEDQDEDAFFDLIEGKRLNVDFVLAPNIVHHVTGRIEGDSKWSPLINVIGWNGGQYFSKAPPLCCGFETWVPNGRFRLAADYMNAEGAFTGSQLLQVRGADVSEVLVPLTRRVETRIPIQIAMSPSRRPSCLETTIGCGFLNVWLIRHKEDGYFEVGPQRVTLLRTNRNGNFAVASVSALSGTYSVVVSTSMNVYAESVVRNSSDLMVEPLVVKPEDPPSPIQVVLAEGAVIEGTTIASGKATRAWVYAIPERPDGTLFRAVTSDAKGKFRLEGLAPAEYTLFATEVELGMNLRNPIEVDYWEAHGQHVKAQLGSSAPVILQQIRIPAELYSREADPRN